MPNARAGFTSFWRDVGAAFALIFRTPLATFIFYGLAFTLSFSAMHGADVQALAYLHSRTTYFWRLISTFAPTIWVLTLVIVLGDVESYRSAWPPTRRGRMVVTFCSILGMPFVILPLLAQYNVWQQEPLLRAAISQALPASISLTKTLIINLLGLAGGFLLGSGMLGLHVQLIDQMPGFRQRAEQPESGGLEADVRWYQRRQEQLSGLLTLFGLYIGTSILSVSAVRHLLNETLAPPGVVLPTAPILGYGLYYTGLLASLYLPAHKLLKDVGRTLAERLVRQSTSASSTCKQRNEERQAAHAWLGLHGSALQDLQQGLSVLTPLLASISSLILGPGE